VQILAFKFAGVLEPHADCGQGSSASARWREQGASVVLRYCSVSGLSWCFTVRNFGIHSARLSEVAIF
jgi:hypothetical protein